jgi:ribonuclease BN (tRNA processing enzyme)
MMADDISVKDIVKLTGTAFTELADEVKRDMSDMYDLMTNKEIKDQWITQQIRLNHCKDLEGKLTTGGTPITPAQIEQCIAFATGDIKRLEQLNEKEHSQGLSK